MPITMVKKTISPTNHFLDIIAKIQLDGGKISDLSYLEKAKTLQITFNHSYDSNASTFKEELLYDDTMHIIHWITHTPTESIIIYQK